MKRIRLFLFTVGVILTTNLWFDFDSSRTWALGSSLYELTGESNYIEDGSLFEVLEVDWEFTQGDETIFVTGSGLYLIDPEQHRLTLDLLVGDTPCGGLTAAWSLCKVNSRGSSLQSP